MLILVNVKHSELLEMFTMLDDDMIKFLVLLNTRGVTEDEPSQAHLL
jgi:hypothetical protein